MELINIIQCYDASKKLGLVKAEKSLEKIITLVSKQLLDSVKPIKVKAPVEQPKTKEVTNAEEEAAS